MLTTTLAGIASRTRFEALDDVADAYSGAAPNPAAAQETPPAMFGGFAALQAALAGTRHAEVPPPPPPPAEADAARREEEARKLAEEGGLKPGQPNPPPTQQELDDLAARIYAADDGAAVALSQDARAMAIATPEQKAALIRKLADGSTGDAEESAIERILMSCTTRLEFDQVVQMSGGLEEIEDELESEQYDTVLAHANGLSAKQEAVAERAVEMLEQAQSPQEFMRLYELFGGPQLKHDLTQGGPEGRDPQKRIARLARLEALAQKFGLPDVGFGMPPEKVVALQDALQKAIDEEDCDAIVQLSENADAMKVASPVQKAQMIRELQEGWTKDSQDMALARILTSCASKAEFDSVVDMAGGREILEDVDLPEAKADINKLMGGFDRLDCADQLATAQAYRGALLPPAVDELGRTREPTDAELLEVLGLPPLADADPSDPAAAEARRRLDEVRAHIGKAAYDIDPMARNKLALVNRERQLEGKPPLDYTSLVNEAYKAANDPAIDAEVAQAFAAAEHALGKLDPGHAQQTREQIVEQRLRAVAEKYGLSEQAMKTLVTAKMGRVLQEGAAAANAASGEIVRSMQLELVEIGRTSGPDSERARSLRDTLRKFATEAQAWTNRLQSTGATVASLFKVPTSFTEDFVSAMAVVADVLAVAVNVIPGVGQAISAAYFGVKAIVNLAQGDLLGAFKSLLSAVPGVSGALGAAGALISTGARVAQAGIAAGEGMAKGDPLAVLGAVGGAAGNLGLDFGKVVPGGAVLDTAIKQGRNVGAVVDGVATGNWSGAFGGLSGLAGAAGVDVPGALRSIGVGELASGIEALGASSAAQGVRATIGHASRFLGAAGARDVAGMADALRQWMPDLAAYTGSRSIGDLADHTQQLLGSSALGAARRIAPDEAREVERILRGIGSVKQHAAAFRNFEDAAIALGAKSAREWRAVAAEMLRRLS